MLKPILPLIACLALTACVSTPTAYIPRGPDNYGFTTTRIEGDRFRIGFAGNPRTDRETVENYLLFRAAEVTLENGGDFFVIDSQDVEALVSYRTTGLSGYDDPIWGPRWYGSYGWRGGGGGGFGFGLETANTRPIPEYDATAVIRIGRGAKPADDPNAFDAREVQGNLGPSVIRAYPQ